MHICMLVTSQLVQLVVLHASQVSRDRPSNQPYSIISITCITIAMPHITRRKGQLTTLQQQVTQLKLILQRPHFHQNSLPKYLLRRGRLCIRQVANLRIGQVLKATQLTLPTIIRMFTRLSMLLLYPQFEGILENLHLTFPLFYLRHLDRRLVSPPAIRLLLCLHIAQQLELEFKQLTLQCIIIRIIFTLMSQITRLLFPHHLNRLVNRLVLNLLMNQRCIQHLNLHIILAQCLQTFR